MRRPYPRTDRYGTPLRPLSDDELRPVNAPPTPRRGQCWHGMNESWIPRCEADGTHRIPDKILDSYFPASARAWVEDARYCPAHKPPYAVPVEKS